MTREQIIADTLIRSFSTADRAAGYAENIAAMGGQDSAVYTDAARLIRTQHGTTDFSTPASREELATLRRFIEHAPIAPVNAVGLDGWWTPHGNYVCAKCSARIMARGCNLPAGSTPVWGHDVKGTCDVGQH